MREKIEVLMKADLNEIMESMIETLNHDEIANFIKEIDTLVADWDFTNEIYEHFENLHQTYLKEVEEDEDIES